MVDRTRSIEFDHELYRPMQTVAGASEALRMLFPNAMPDRVLDVGCGTGTWLRAALDGGATDVFGVDGVDLPTERLYIAKTRMLQADLGLPVNLNRQFDLVICLETAEHLEPDSAATLIDTLAAHGDRILFSAAPPGQSGMHHVNCRWPSHWQTLFNDRGFACDDSVRWVIWDNRNIEPWYRQNMFMAERDESRAGREPRIKSVIHPDMVEPWAFFDMREIQSGALPWHWYALTAFRAVAAKVRRRLK